MPDASQGTLTVMDNGIGMNRDDLADNLGTIARSGTQRFVQKLSGDNASDLNLIGQFGVGFYSVHGGEPDRGRLAPGRGGAQLALDVRWPQRLHHRGDGGAGAARHRGHPASRDDAKEFLDEWRLRQIVRNYSDHIAVPILLEIERKGNGEAKEGDDAAKGPEQVNQASARWTWPKSDITDEQYKEFYHHVAHAFDEPWARLHVKAEGVVSYQALLFVPGEAVRPVRPAAPARCQAVRQARVHHR